MTTECSWPIMAPSWRPGAARCRGGVAGSSRAVSSRDRPMTVPRLGSLTWLPASDRPDLLGAPVAAALPTIGGPVWVAEIDDTLADTAAFMDAYGVPPEASANCVVVA